MTLRNKGRCSRKMSLQILVDDIEIRFKSRNNIKVFRPAFTKLKLKVCVLFEVNARVDIPGCDS